MRRKIYEKLLAWKRDGARETALLIDGARRVGKSYIVEEFAKKEYKSYLLIDFVTAGNDVKELFNRYLNDLDTFFLFLSEYYHVKLYKGESLIIFDEVQLFPRAREAIKYLVADGRFDYMETGSLVSIKKNVKDIVIPSEERHLSLYPMDFEEFLWALGHDTLMSLVGKCFTERKPLGQAMHRRTMDLFRQYLIVGGMPQAVAEYAKSRDFDRVDQIKRDILRLYREDMMKHAAGYEAKVASLFDEIPQQLAKHDRKFRISALGRDARKRNYEDAIFWLSDAMIVNMCYNTTDPNVGMKLNRENARMKCYMADTGLLISHAFDENGIVSEDIYRRLLFDKLEVNLGMIVENAVAQMLKSTGKELYFYTKASTKNKDERMEIDFLLVKRQITNRHNVSPVEVKSSKRYTLTSLQKFRARFAEQTDIPYVLHPADLEVEDGIVRLPLYMTPFL